MFSTPFSEYMRVFMEILYARNPKNAIASQNLEKRTPSKMNGVLYWDKKSKKKPHH
jgi:hypothetical protein